LGEGVGEAGDEEGGGAADEEERAEAACARGGFVEDGAADTGRGFFGEDAAAEGVGGARVGRGERSGGRRGR
jgi:hypothetical protein